MKIDLDTLAAKKKWIAEQESRFAWDLARRVIDLPRLSMWMILIPIILVYHVHRHKNALKGRSVFVDHYLLSRIRSLDEACRAVSGQREPDIDGLVARAVDLPETARPAYRAWVAALIRHFSDLLRAQGTDFSKLVREAYRSRANYLLFLNRLNGLEKDLDAALNVHLAETAGDVAETIRRIETATAELRRLLADAVFP